MRQRLQYNFLLKRKLAIGIYIKVVGWITTFLMSGQPLLKAIPTRSYDHIKKSIDVFKKSTFKFFLQAF
jgi:hypothetical protein